ncbi:MAG TPA: nucleotidyltransferase family protein [Gemmatimonadaceae bacterium]|nr:nucleotidyltransferase family protein [Gemmatimonadaceae bacterium]
MSSLASRLPLSREAALLLSMAGTASGDAGWAATLARPVEWERLVRLAQRERAAPALWRRLQALGCPGMPATERERLRQLAQVGEFQARQLEQRLHAALAALHAADVEVMLLKGAAVAHAVYPQFADRPMADVDLLVRPDQAAHAHAVLQAAGWTLGPRAAALGAAYDAHHHHLPPLSDAVSGAGLDLHTELFAPGHPFALSAADMWRRGIPIWVGGQPARLPAAHDLLLHACLHFAWSHELRHGAWRAFHDVARLLAAGQVDSRAFADLAAESRGATSCYWTLRLAATVGAVAMPSGVLRALRPRLPEPVLGRLERHFALGLLPAEGGCPSVRVTRMLWRAGMRPGASGHGGARPWQLGQRTPPASTAGGVASPRPGRTVASHWQRAAEWRSYGWAMVRPAAWGRER